MAKKTELSAHIFQTGTGERKVTLTSTTVAGNGNRYAKRMTIPVEQWGEFKELVNGFDPNTAEVVTAADLQAQKEAANA